MAALRQQGRPSFSGVDSRCLQSSESLISAVTAPGAWTKGPVVTYPAA
jgi:hypothetical protein